MSLNTFLINMLQGGIGKIIINIYHVYTNKNTLFQKILHEKRTYH